MRRSLLTTLLAVGGCASGSHQIARSTTNIGNLAQSSLDRFQGIHSSATSPTPDTGYIAQEAETGMQEQKTIIEEVTKVVHALPGIRDLSPWWAELITYGLIFGTIVAILVFMWRLGLDRLIRGWMGMATPRANAEASLAADIVATTNDPHVLRTIERRRTIDHDFDIAFRKKAPPLNKKRKMIKNDTSPRKR